MRPTSFHDFSLSSREFSFPAKWIEIGDGTDVGETELDTSISISIVCDLQLEQVERGGDYCISDRHDWVSRKVFPCEARAHLTSLDLSKQGYQDIHKINPILRFKHLVGFRFSYRDVDRWFSVIQYVDNILGRKMTME